ncbi:MAG: hypothetical protein KC933_39920, partial [Myxococcales bacterium]|nr:hypothetical protein [Myxococcales bacterium]
MTPALLLLLAAAPPVPQVTRVSVPDARALPRLRPLLAWASLALPSLRPEAVEQALAPLKLDPFVPEAGWAE